MQFKVSRKDIKSFQTLFNSSVTQSSQSILSLHQSLNITLTCNRSYEALEIITKVITFKIFLFVGFADLANFIKSSN